jgi:putative Mg2+ transporter-C (MgtC) family protein
MLAQYSPTVLIAIKLVVAILCGGAIGFERELSRKAAGLRTNVLICMGAALFMIVSRHISGGAPYSDPGRLVAQVVTGVGFIGAGVILQARGSVTGLTTAATIFVVAAVGITIGEGMFTVALLSTALIIVVLVVLRRIERMIIRRQRLFHYSLRTQNPSGFLERLLDLLEQERMHLEDFEVRDVADGAHEIRLSVVTSLAGNQRLLHRLRTLGGDLRTSTHEHTD